jgi:AcrR family transcriptional regulator
MAAKGRALHRGGNMAEAVPVKAATRESREEILQAAAELFMEFGFAATSIDAVAERLGSTKGRIYHHYRSKADLFFEVQVAAMARLFDQVEPLARRSGNALERLSAMALRHIQIILTELPMQKVAVQGLERHLFGATSTNKRLRAVVKLRDDYETLFAEVIDDGIREGLFVDWPPKLATKPFFGALNWATVWYSPRRLQSAEALDELAEALAAFALRGLVKDSQHPAALASALLRNTAG